MHPEDARGRGAPRKMDAKTATLAMLIYNCKNYSYKALGYMFGVKESTMCDNCHEVEIALHGDLTGRLFCMMSPDRIQEHIPASWKEHFPGAFCAGDGMPVAAKMSEFLGAEAHVLCVQGRPHLLGGVV